MIRTDQECIVCGKARFLIQGDPWFFSPLVCSKECCLEDTEYPISYLLDWRGEVVVGENGQERDIDYLTPEGNEDEDHQEG